MFRFLRRQIELIWGRAPVELESPLPLDECIYRVNAVAAKWRYWLPYANAFGSSRVVGRANGDSLKLRVRHWYSASGQRFLNAGMVAEVAGTRIVGEFGMSRLERMTSAVWFILVGVIALACEVGFCGEALGLNGGRRQGHLWMGIVIPPAIPLFGWLLFRLSRWLDRNDLTVIKDFLCETLECREPAEDVLV
jgi:hypothetical protein